MEWVNKTLLLFKTGKKISRSVLSNFYLDLTSIELQSWYLDRRDLKYLFTDI